jgi:hypothetical protein
MVLHNSDFTDGITHEIHKIVIMKIKHFHNKLYLANWYGSSSCMQSPAIGIDTDAILVVIKFLH